MQSGVQQQMDMLGSQREQLYQQQCIQLRRAVREADLKAQGLGQDDATCVFLVVGPAGSGKSSFLQTMQLALNGSVGWGRARRGAVTAVQVKRGMRWQVEGVREVTQTDRRYAIVGLQLHAEEKPCTRYKRALEFTDRGVEGCLQKGCEPTGGVLARVCVVCLDGSADMPYEEMTYLRFLKVDLLERHIKLLFLLTKTEQRALTESERCLWLESRIRQVMKELDVKDRDDIIVFENYCFPEKEDRNGKLALSSIHTSKVEINNEINYYALQLLLRIMRENQRIRKNYSKSSNKSWICGWT